MKDNSKDIVQRMIDSAKLEYKIRKGIPCGRELVQEQITLAKMGNDKLNITPPEDDYFKFIGRLGYKSYLDFYRLKN